MTAFEIGEQSAHKPLGRFGCALVSRPVREGRAMAEAGPIARRLNQESEKD